MAVTQIELDVELLAEVLQISGAATPQEAVEFAMRDLVVRNHTGEAGRRAQRQARDQELASWKVLNGRDRANVVHG
ncbi:MAG: type II toxin-antitoxin system VapB family antitoxin [Nocardioides sp.]|nr:type II toxin-antitoxin system VapB family antitoxin [Nocardioides sp.]